MAIVYSIEPVRDDGLIARLGGFQTCDSVALACLFGGDRAHCCDEATVALVGEQTVGACTISPRGEMDQGEPAIVGLYVRRAHRRRGVGTALLTYALTRMQERGLTPARVDLLSDAAVRLVAALPDNYRALLRVHSQGDILPVITGDRQ